MTVDFIEIRVQYAGLCRLQRAGQPAVVRRAIGADAGVGEHRFGHGLHLQGATARLRPVQRKAAAVIAAILGLVNEARILLVQGVGLEHQIQADQVGVAGQGGASLAAEFGTQVVTAASFECLHQPCEAVAVLVGIHEVALDTQGLGFAVGLQAQAGTVVEQFGIGLEHLRCAAPRLGKRGSHQQGDDGQQAQAGEQGDLPLDGQTSLRHGLFLLGQTQRPRSGGRRWGHSAMQFGGATLKAFVSQAR